MYSTYTPAGVRIAAHISRIAGRRRWAAAATAFAGLLIVPGAAQAADLAATPSTFSSVFSSAKAGDSVVLASGSYGSFKGGSKTGLVTVKAASIGWATKDLLKTEYRRSKLLLTRNLMAHRFSIFPLTSMALALLPSTSPRGRE